VRGVLAARALRSFARESVGGIGLDRPRLEAGGPDVFEVPIYLAGASNLRGPKLGLARGRVRDLSLSHDVG
jgi:hypothetical protein